jgi:alpha-D-ribose 1-methylphosphonate 5-triphosphate synthase subunit PhnH
MSLDLVHDIQAAYRKTIDAISQPGSLHSIREQADKVEIACGCFNSTVVLALMLMDTEVRFKVVSGREGELTKLLNQLTYAKAAETAVAQFILVTGDAQAEDVELALRDAYPGSLLDPHQSATVIFEVEELRAGAETNLQGEPELILSGPGIERENFIQVKTSFDWVEPRAEKNKEYPLGIDFIFTDPNGNMLALPRTTQIKKQETK